MRKPKVEHIDKNTEIRLDNIEISLKIKIFIFLYNLSFHYMGKYSSPQLTEKKIV